MEPSESKVSNSVEINDEKTVENYRNCYVVEKRIVSKLSKITQIDALNEGCVKISCLYLLYFPRIGRQKALGSGRAFSSASSKIVLKMFFNLF